MQGAFVLSDLETFCERVGVGGIDFLSRDPQEKHQRLVQVCTCLVQGYVPASCRVMCLPRAGLCACLVQGYVPAG